MGLSEIADCFDDAEKNVSDDDFYGCLSCLRTALEKSIQFYLLRKNLEETINFENDVNRLVKKGFLTKEQKDTLRGIVKAERQATIMVMDDELMVLDIA